MQFLDFELRRNYYGNKNVDTYIQARSQPVGERGIPNNQLKSSKLDFIA